MTNIWKIKKASIKDDEGALSWFLAERGRVNSWDTDEANVLLWNVARVRAWAHTQYAYGV